MPYEFRQKSLPKIIFGVLVILGGLFVMFQGGMEMMFGGIVIIIIGFIIMRSGQVREFVRRR